ncbi:hypothetical protein ACQKWADRAFT_329661 [Trichoderma austrokoningii]
MLDELRPPKFEIEDLCMPESDPLYHNAVLCVQTYWKQAANMTEGQRQKYLWYLQKSHMKYFVEKPFESAGGTITAHNLYQRARDDAGNFVRLSWPAFLLLSSLYGDLPQRYSEAIATKYGTSDIEDHTAIYRHFHPAPIRTMEKVKMESATVQTSENALVRETPGEPTATDTYKSIKSENEDHTETKTPVTKAGDETHLESCDRSSAPEPASSQSTWSIDSIVDALATPKIKRSSSTLESSPKRTKLGTDEISNHVNQQTEVIRKMIHEAQLDQQSKLQNIQQEVEKSVQTLNGMHTELRQFMSAVASALKNIREHLNK